MRNQSGILSQATPINSTATLRDRVNRKNPTDVYRFNVTSLSNLNLRVRGSGQGAKVRLIQDLNQNGMADADEVMQTAQIRPRTSRVKTALVNVANLSAGDYFIEVSALQRGTTTYKLNLVTAAAPDSGFSLQSTPPASNPFADFVNRVVQLTNDFRQRNGLQPVTLNSRLSEAAEQHSRDMALNDYFAHAGSDGSTVGTRVSAAGYDWSLVAENIAAGFTDPANVVQGWIDSPGHRANMLLPSVKEIGVGFFYLPDDTGTQTWKYYWTQNFANPE